MNVLSAKLFSLSIMRKLSCAQALKTTLVLHVFVRLQCILNQNVAALCLLIL